jgi:RNA polymerase sigma-70 factor (ECF subfamily)
LEHPLRSFGGKVKKTTDGGNPDGSDPPTTVYLVGKAKAGDNNAVDELFRRYLPRVRQIVALRMQRPVSSLAAQQDIVQEACLRAFQGLDRFEFRSEGSFYNYLGSCVQGAILDAVDAARAKKRDARKERSLQYEKDGVLAGAVLVAKGPRPSGYVHAKELEEEIERALLELPAHQREIIILARICGMSHKEIMEEMNFHKESSSRKALSFALHKLEQKLQEKRNRIRQLK